MQQTAALPAPSRAMRLFHAIPLIGWIAKDIGRDVNNLFYALPILVLCLVLAVKLWGLVALTMTALALVPVMFVIFIWITLP